MLIPETIIVEEVLPSVRRSVARSLSEGGWSQARIAEILATSQAMISKYLREENQCPGSLNEVVYRISRELLLGARAGEGSVDISVRFCTSVRSCMDQGLLTARFKERFGVQPHPLCFERTGVGSRSRVMDDLNTALELLKGRDLERMVPALKINMVQGIEGASSVQEVASFPGRLMDRGGRIIGANPPEFGASRHLASTLTAAMGSDPSIRSAASVRYDSRIEIALEGENLRMIDHEREDAKDAVSGITVEEYLCDPGDFGVEPCLYIFGFTALDVAGSIIELNERTEKGVDQDENE